MSRFIDASGDRRCLATVTLRDKSTAQCGRSIKVNGLCWQHEKQRKANTEKPSQSIPREIDEEIA